SVSGCQYRPRDRRAISAKSKISLAILRTAARRSGALPSPFIVGSSRVETTRSMAPLSCSWAVAAQVVGAVDRMRRAAAASPETRRRVITGPPSVLAGVLADGMADVLPSVPANVRARPVSLDLAEDVFRQELFEVDGRLHLGELAVRLDDAIG